MVNLPDVDIATIIRNLTATTILVGLVLFGRFFLLRSVRTRLALNKDTRLHWTVMIRNLSILITMLGIGVIWAHEIRVMALSFAAIAVAMVIATKELIVCVLGGILRGGTQPFSVGDRIEVQHHRGDVIDQSLLTTTILEIGPGNTSHQYTGRAITIPNSLLLNNPVINETFTDEYVLHVFTFPMSIYEDFQLAERLLLDAAQEECKSFLEQARHYMRKMAKDKDLDPPNVEPRISLGFPEPGQIHLLVRIPAPARRKGRIEQAILRKFMKHYAACLAEYRNNSGYQFSSAGSVINLPVKDRG
jgi:small-conductance mechanosensitive channel